MTRAKRQADDRSGPPARFIRFMWNSGQACRTELLIRTVYWSGLLVLLVLHPVGWQRLFHVRLIGRGERRSATRWIEGRKPQVRGVAGVDRNRSRGQHRPQGQDPEHVPHERYLLSR